MPAVSAPAKVLVTGATGFLAVHVVKTHIERGYTVRGTVRTTTKGEYLKKLLGDKFEYVVVPDMQKPNAYDEAVKGIDVVQHLAAIVQMDGTPDDIVGPIVAAATGILEAVKKYGSNVKRVILCSSTEAVGTSKDESTYNDAAVASVEKLGDKTPGFHSYGAGKTLAEKGAWKFMEDNKDTVKFDLVVLCPSWVFGPMLQPGDINFSIQYVLGGLDPKNPKTGDELTQHQGEAVDVRDLANVFVDVVSIEEAGGERFIAANAPWTFQHTYNLLNESPAFSDIPVGQPDSIKGATYFSLSNVKLQKLLGKPASEVWRPLGVTLRDTVTDARSKGWVAASA